MRRSPSVVLLQALLRAAPFDPAPYDEKARSPPRGSSKTFQLPAGHHPEIAAAELLLVLDPKNPNYQQLRQQLQYLQSQ